MKEDPKDLPQLVVKLQISQFSSEGGLAMLAYDESREHMYQSKASEEVLKLMDDRPKAFFYAELKPDGEGVKFVIGEEAPWQNW